MTDIQDQANGQAAAQAPEPLVDAPLVDAPLVEELLVEEVSIDGMCGVY